MTWYKTGTVAVTPGSNAVLGTGTSFIANARVGDAFRGPDGEWYEVTNIASDTALSIAPNYQGVAEAAGGYSLAPMQGYVKDSADALRAATQVIASGVADMQEQVAAATEAAQSAGQSKADATEQAGIASAAAEASTDNKDAAQLAAQQSQGSAQASGAAADRSETARDSIIQSEQAAAASAAAAADSAAHAEEVTEGKAASGDNNDITSLRALTADGFDRVRQGLEPVVGATASVAGTKGLVPAPSVADRLKVLSGAGTWVPLSSGASWGAITGSLSAQADLQTALDSKQSLLSAPFTKFFESPQTAWTVGGQLTFTHGLGAIPKYVEIEVIATVAFNATPVGTRFNAIVVISGSYLGAQVDGKTATSITVRCGSTMVRMVNQNSGDQGTPTNTQLIIRAAA
ncbi:hypothetical protein [Pseudomonas sp. CHM02]|uniref:hypothetical protein n=1 Tax=Pseudomonas sp. CHM02 TaxID=1463662 RepID=UPI00046F6CDB|nr:hypothetical protein [Pseudomonas sp. CHM02]